MRKTLLDQAIKHVMDIRRVDLSAYRRETLEKRIAVRIEQAGCQDISGYLKKLRGDPSECDRLIDCIAINVSSFFRNSLVFEILARNVLPDIIERKLLAGNSELRVWSAGCAAGEEPYSVAILIHEALKNQNSTWTVHLFASDIDGEILQQAASASYKAESLENTKFGYVERYFIRRNNQYELKPILRKMVHFSQEDLTSPQTIAPVESVFGTFDIVLCRNVLIYFDSKMQNLVLKKLFKALGIGGYLILGEAESLSGALKPYFDCIDDKNRIYRKHH